MAEYLLLGDIHLADRPPSSCTEDYLDDLFALLEETVALALQRQVTAVIWAGDIFHFKTPGRTTHRTVRRLIDHARTYPCPVCVVPGNHDLTNDRLASLDETQPLGVVLASGAVHVLDRWMLPTERLDRDGWLDPLYGVPWLGTFTDDTVQAALAEYRDDPGDAEHHLVVTHAPLYPPGLELPYEHYPTRAWAAAMGGHGSVYYGHIHEPHGIYTVDGVTFCNPGALSRGSLHEHNLTRAVSCAAWDSTTGEFEIIPLPHKPAAQVFRLAEAGQARSAQVELDRFLDSIGQTRIEITSIESVVAHIRSLRLGAAVEALVEELLIETGGR